MCYGYDGEGALRRSLAERGMSRRSMLGAAVFGTAGAAALATAGPAAAAAAGPGRGRRRVPPGLISIQLYTLRDIMTVPGVNGVLRTLGDIGYPRVELAGYYGKTAKQMRRRLDRNGLQGSSSHEGISATPEALEAKLDNAEVIGQRYMNVPYLASDSLSQWQAWAEQMNVEAAAASERGIRYGYHNHAHEFTTDLGRGRTPWDVLTRELDRKDVHLEVDLYWIVTGGVNLGMSRREATHFAIHGIHDAPQKVRQYHVKDRKVGKAGDTADLGTGWIDFAEIISHHQVEEYIVENDTPDVTPIQTAEVGYDYLRNLRY